MISEILSCIVLIALAIIMVMVGVIVFFILIDFIRDWKLARGK